MDYVSPQVATREKQIKQFGTLAQKEEVKIPNEGISSRPERAQQAARLAERWKQQLLLGNIIDTKHLTGTKASMQQQEVKRAALDIIKNEEVFFILELASPVVFPTFEQYVKGRDYYKPEVDSAINLRTVRIILGCDALSIPTMYVEDVIKGLQHAKHECDNFTAPR